MNHNATHNFSQDFNETFGLFVHNQWSRVTPASVVVGANDNADDPITRHIAQARRQAHRDLVDVRIATYRGLASRLP